MDLSGRVLCRYDEGRKGPLLICLGGIHGNEPAGVQAIQTVGHLLEKEKTINPGFRFHGRMLGLAGNLQALRQGRRFIHTDLNRALRTDQIERILQKDQSQLVAEELEIAQLITLIRAEIGAYQPERIIVLDIHSTSASGGIFVIAASDEESVRIGTSLHAPVILDFSKEVSGTTLGYFTPENFDCDIVTIVFECGQHQESLSVNRAVAAIVHCMRTIGCVLADAVEHKHDMILREYSKGLPKVSRLVERFGIPTGGKFRMAREFENFADVAHGEIVAYLDGHPIRANHDGLLLLPRLQEQGDDGFFIVKPVMTEIFA